MHVPRHEHRRVVAAPGEVAVEDPRHQARVARQQARIAIEEALERAERTEERLYFPELLRLRGELLLADGDAEAAHACFDQSLRNAREQNAISWELRTATCLARCQPGRVAPLRSVLQRFTEGFMTGDVTTGKRLLEELQQ